MRMLYFMFGWVEHETGYKYVLTVLWGASFVLLMVKGLCLDQVLGVKAGPSRSWRCDLRLWRRYITQQF